MTDVLWQTVKEVLFVYGVLLVIVLVGWYAVTDFRSVLADLYRSVRDEVAEYRRPVEPEPTLVDWRERGWFD